MRIGTPDIAQGPVPIRPRAAQWVTRALPASRVRREDIGAPGVGGFVLRRAGLRSSALTAEGASIPPWEDAMRLIGLANPSPGAPCETGIYRVPACRRPRRGRVRRHAW
jgi:hypothetical protein